MVPLLCIQSTCSWLFLDHTSVMTPTALCFDLCLVFFLSNSGSPWKQGWCLSWVQLHIHYSTWGHPLFHPPHQMTDRLTELCTWKSPKENFHRTLYTLPVVYIVSPPEKANTFCWERGFICLLIYSVVS